MICGCNFCGKMKKVEKICGKYVCEECFEKICLNKAALDGCRWWVESLIFQDKYENNIDRILNKIIENM